MFTNMASDVYKYGKNVYKYGVRVGNVDTILLFRRLFYGLLRSLTFEKARLFPNSDYGILEMVELF